MTGRNGAETEAGAPETASGQGKEAAAMPLTNRLGWILSDGKAGDLAQCEGVANALGLITEQRRIAPHWPWSLLAPWGPVDPRDRPHRPGSALRPPFPDIAIASGRQTVPYLRALRRLSGGATFTVFLKDPRTGPGTADFIWAPMHDRIAGPNVMKTLIGPHRFSPAAIAAERASLPATIRKLPAPICTVLLGGSNKIWRYNEAACALFESHLRRIAALGVSFLITPSRRSDDALIKAAKRAVSGSPQIFWDGTGDNPYRSFLAAADMLVVTADSANMLGEATVTGRPVFFFAPDQGAKAGPQTKFDRFLHMLEAEGLARPLTGPLESWTYKPQYTATEIAHEIARRFLARQAGGGEAHKVRMTQQR